MEMEVRELRIGNYVYPAYSGNMKGDEIKVVANDIPKCEAGVYFLNPIPLTEEWLVKFGFFETAVFRFFTKGNGIGFQKSGGSYWLAINKEDSIVDIKYVHQLQNLYFALTGEELTIENG